MDFFVIEEEDGLGFTLAVYEQVMPDRDFGALGVCWCSGQTLV